MPDQTVAPGMALANLIEQRRVQLGLSYGKVADRGGIKRPTVYALATKPLKQMPETENLLGLALGLQLPPEEITAAANEACGLPMYSRELPSDPTKRMLISNIDKLDDQEVDAVAAAVDSFLRSRRGK